MKKKSKKTIAVAESCTGGSLGSRITETPGSSEYFLGGIICYSDAVKEKMLKVTRGDLKKYGAVSEVVAKKMAEGVRKALRADIGIAITGIAGPGGGSKLKPVGLVYIARAASANTLCKKFLFKGSRQAIRTKAVNQALRFL